MGQQSQQQNPGYNMPTSGAQYNNYGAGYGTPMGQSMQATSFEPNSYGASQPSGIQTANTGKPQGGAGVPQNYQPPYSGGNPLTPFGVAGQSGYQGAGGPQSPTGYTSGPFGNPGGTQGTSSGGGGNPFTPGVNPLAYGNGPNVGGYGPQTPYTPPANPLAYGNGPNVGQNQGPTTNNASNPNASWLNFFGGPQAQQQYAQQVQQVGLNNPNAVWGPSGPVWSANG